MTAALPVLDAPESGAKVAAKQRSQSFLAPKFL
jgi:hypothetical protein